MAPELLKMAWKALLEKMTQVHIQTPTDSTAGFALDQTRQGCFLSFSLGWLMSLPEHNWGRDRNQRGGCRAAQPGFCSSPPLTSVYPRCCHSPSPFCLQALWTLPFLLQVPSKLQGRAKEEGAKGNEVCDQQKPGKDGVTLFFQTAEDLIAGNQE